MPPLTLISLNQRVQTLESYLTKIKILITILSFLGISAVGALAYIIHIVKTVEAEKDKAVVAAAIAERAANEADSILKEIKKIDIHKIREELGEAVENYRIISQNLNQAINRYNVISAEYQEMIGQLSTGIDLYMPALTSSRGVYLKGIIRYRLRDNMEQDGEIIQPARIMFNDSNFPIQTINDTLRVQIRFSP